MTPAGDGNPVVTIEFPETVSAGATIPITMRIANTSSEPLELYLHGREATYDFIVTSSDGDIVWRRLEGQTVQAILRVDVLAPGQALELRESWNQRDNAGKRVAPGSYYIRGTLLGEGSSALESPVVPLRIKRKWS
jgi:hypothetical protein